MSNSYKKSKNKIEKERYELSLKYAKTTFARYMTAFLFVYSIYWFYLALLTKPILAIIPFIFFVSYLTCMIDQYASLHNHKKKKFNWTINIMKITSIFDILMIFIALFNYKMLFPYYSKYYYPIIIFMIALVIKLFITKKIEKFNKEN